MTNMVLDEYGIENLGPGDTLVCNDAFRGGIHFGDLNFFRVIHDEHGKPAFVVSDAAHVFDIGGPVAGGFNTAATSMYEEGLRLSPMLITSSDEPVRSVDQPAAGEHAQPAAHDRRRPCAARHAEGRRGAGARS